jgi:hypothetical protein
MSTDDSQAAIAAGSLIDFWAAAKYYPWFECVAVSSTSEPPYDEFGWPSVPLADGDHIGLIDHTKHWGTVIPWITNSGDFLMSDSRWLWLDNRLWQVAFFRRPANVMNKKVRDDFMIALDALDCASNHVAGCFESKRPPYAADLGLTRDRREDRFLEVVLSTVETESDHAFLIKRSNNIFATAARMVDRMGGSGDAVSDEHRVEPTETQKIILKALFACDAISEEKRVRAPQISELTRLDDDSRLRGDLSNLRKFKYLGGKAGSRGYWATDAARSVVS